MPASTAVSLNENPECTTMQFTNWQHSRLFKQKYWKLYNAVYCLKHSSFLNGNTEYSTMQLIPAGQHSRLFKRKYWKFYNAVYCMPATTAVSLNGNTECSRLMFSACEHSRFFKRKY
jgi:hypothetical protein